MKKFFLPMLMAVAVPAMAQDRLPVRLTQDLMETPTTVIVYGNHDVKVVCDTLNYIAVNTMDLVGAVLESDSLTTKGQIKTDRYQVVVEADYPIRDGIEVHTSSPALALNAFGYSRVSLLSDISDTIRLQKLMMKAGEHGMVAVEMPVVTDKVNIDAGDYGIVRYTDIASPEVEHFHTSEGRIEQVGVDPDGAYRFTLDEQLHELFGGWSFFMSGWSGNPFGGLTGTMRDYDMSVTAYGGFDIRLGYNFFRTRHWDIGAGLATHYENFTISNRLMGTTFDATTGSTHLGPVDEPAYYTSNPARASQTRVWSSFLQAAYLQLPIRVEWHRRMDYKGLRLSAELRPGISLHSSDESSIVSQCTWTEGEEADRGRIDYIHDTIGALYNRFRLDLRLEVGWGHASLFVQSALTPLFRSAKKDDQPYLDEKIYPMMIGFSINY
ncbi:MAG: hypothetical protein IJ634_06555 [Bacteroidales bacterium]|nr:hypothetical protein [Bacteroidales bacterium]